MVLRGDKATTKTKNDNDDNDGIRFKASYTRFDAENFQ